MPLNYLNMWILYFFKLFKYENLITETNQGHVKHLNLDSIKIILIVEYELTFSKKNNIKRKYMGKKSYIDKDEFVFF